MGGARFVRVWLIDDSEADLYLMRRAVSKACPTAQISTFSSVVEAISSWRELPPDCLFLDMNLGAESGLDFVDAIDGAPERAPAVNIAISGVALPADCIERLRSSRVPWRVRQKPLRAEHVAAVLAQAGFLPQG